MAGLRIEKFATPEALRNFGATLLPEDPNRTLPSEMQFREPIIDGARRPSVNDLYNELDLVDRKPLDYTGLEDINRKRAEASRNDLIGGLILSTMGGSAMAPAGGHILQAALEAGKPIRPNAADIGWTDPVTGKVVENPQMRRASDEKVIMNRIDALTKEAERKYNLALQAGKADEAARHMRVLEALASQRNAISNVTVINQKDGSGKDNFKDISSQSRKKLEETTSDHQILSNMAATFKPEYAGGVTGIAGADAAAWVGTNFPDSARRAAKLAGKEKEFNQAMATTEWWRTQKRLDEIPARHAAFGSAFTANEQAAWDAATIRPGMEAWQIQNAVDKRRHVLAQKAARIARTEIQERRRPGSVRAATEGAVEMDDDGNITDPVAPTLRLPPGSTALTPAPSAAPATATPAPARRAGDMSAADQAVLDAFRKKKAGGKP